MRSPRRRRLLTIAVAVGVAVAFADSSIVVLALPELYGAFNTSIVGVSWVITSYNLVVAVCAFALVPLVKRVDVGVAEPGRARCSSSPRRSAAPRRGRCRC